MYSPTMRLTDEERAVLAGNSGEAKRKAMETIVRFGDVFGADRLVDLDHGVHLVTSFGIPLLKPVFDIMDELIEAGCKTPEPFTADPRPCDFANVPVGLVPRIVFTKVMYAKQKAYEAQLAKVGLKDGKAFTCACYFDEVGNIPKEGDMLAWAESSAVVYANSVLGARSNRNSGVLELLCGIVGKAPRFGFLTDEGRKASWIIELKTTARPEAQLLGSAIGMRVMEDVPYIRGLDRYLGGELNADAKDYLKDMGAATASNGAVGLYHVEGLTPEAKAQGAALVRKDARTYVIDDAEIARVRAAYPVMWKDPDARPERCFIGCPHLSKAQLYGWLDTLEAALAKAGRRRLAIPTVLTTAPDVEAAFRADESAMRRLRATGATVSAICPLMYMNNPLCGKKPVITNSNKLRTYTKARYYADAEIAALAAGGTL